MWRTLLYREVYDGFTSFTFLSAFTLLTLLVPLSAYTQGRYYRNVLADYKLRQELRESENAWATAVITRPIPALLPFFNGIHDSLPNEIALNINSALRTPSSEDLNVLDWLFPRTDLSLIIGVLLTLMAILFGHDAITHEREQGTLQFILSGPVARRSIILVKLAGVTLILALCLVYALSLYLVIIITANGALSFSSLPSGNLFTFVVVSFLTLVVFGMLGIAVSTMVKSSSRALGISMGVWVVMVVIWPSFGSYISSLVWPVAPRQVAEREWMQKEGEMIKEEIAAQTRTAKALEDQKTSVETAWQEHLALRREWLLRRREEVGRMTADRRKQVNRQQQTARLLCVVSPYGAFKESIGTICGTGFTDYNAFLDFVDRFDKESFIPAMFDSFSKARPWIKDKGDESPPQFPAAQVPVFTFGERLKGMVLPVSLILLEIVMLIAVSIIKFESYDVRRANTGS
jgi:ABC-type transport system involved in multi-copper enzyme maturation permease subunit